jgi:hypothetical protein
MRSLEVARKMAFGLAVSSGTFRLSQSLLLTPISHFNLGMFISGGL